MEEVFDTVPVEILCLILAFVQQYDATLKVAASVCSRWNSIVKILRKRLPKKIHQLDDELLKKLVKEFPNLESLEISGFSSKKVTSKGYSCIGSLYNLRRLICFLSSRSIPTDLNSWRQLKELRTLSLIRFGYIPDDTFSFLPHLKSLTSLEIRNNYNLGIPALEYISRIKSLEQLSILTLKLTPERIDVLARLPNLKRLKIDNSLELNDYAMESFSKMKNLQSLELNLGPGVSAAGLLRLNLPFLQQLHLTGASFFKVSSPQIASHFSTIPHFRMTYFVELRVQ